MTFDILDYITSMLDSQNIQCTFLNASINNISTIDCGLRLKLGLDHEYASIEKWINHHCEADTIYILNDSFSLSYIIFKLPAELLEIDEYAILGPLLFQPLSRDTFSNLARTHRWSDTLQTKLLTFYEQITIFPSESRFIALLISLLKNILNENISVRYLDLLEQEIEPNGITSPQLSMDSEPDFSLIQLRYKTENDLLEAVKHGNYSKAVLYHKKFMQYQLKARVSNLVRNEQNMCIIFNSLLRKAVEQAQVHPYHIDQLSRRFAIKIESCTTSEQLHSLANKMLHKYCILVQNYSLAHYSSLIQKCITYIDFHYTENITLDVITQELNLSKCYLSNLFKKEVGVTITDFIHKTQLRHALQLLNGTQLPIHDIALQCGFDDINYFSRVFKKYQGQTPSNYRKMIHQIHQ